MNGQVRRQSFDALVIGSGVAGCTTALELVERGAGRVGLVTKGRLGESTTAWAQGGIAAALSVDDDSVELHEADTLRAGGGLSDPDAVRVLVAEGPVAVRVLLGRGAVFDLDGRRELARAREGGHSVARVVHAGGMATGAEVTRALTTALATSGVTVLERVFVTDLVVERGRCCGVSCLDGGLRRVQLDADAVVLATGGAGVLFDVTTNPAETTGDGIAIALRAGAPVADLEFVQFHPTALCVDREPRPLLSEGLRGYGALLVDQQGERFVDELASRDVVEPRDRHPDDAGRSEERLPRRKRCPRLCRPVSDDRGDARRGRARRRAGPASRRAGRPLPVRRRRHGPRGTERRPWPLRDRRGRVQRRPGREPAGVEFAARRARLRLAGGAGDRRRRE